jgi:hypothetical protein
MVVDIKSLAKYSLQTRCGCGIQGIAQIGHGRTWSRQRVISLPKRVRCSRAVPAETTRMRQRHPLGQKRHATRLTVTLTTFFIFALDLGDSGPMCEHGLADCTLGL